VLAPLGYTCASQSLFLVKYRGGVERYPVLNVRYDNGRSYEVGVEFVIPSDTAATFTLGQLMASTGKQPFEADGHQATTVAALSVVLKLLAQLTTQYAMALLQGDEVAVARAQRFVSESAARYGAERDAGAARRAAESAWSVRDYKKVVAALQAVADTLSPAELARLDYCLRKSRDAEHGVDDSRSE